MTKVYRFILIIENEILKRKKSQQKLLQDLTFSAFNKVKKWTSKFLKTPETKKMCHKTFKCLKLLLFKKKIKLTEWKMLEKLNNQCICNSFFLHYSPCQFKFLWRIFFSRCLDNFDVLFWTLLGRKNEILKQFLTKKKFVIKVSFSILDLNL